MRIEAVVRMEPYSIQPRGGRVYLSTADSDIVDQVVNEGTEDEFDDDVVQCITGEKHVGCLLKPAATTKGRDGY